MRYLPYILPPASPQLMKLDLKGHALDFSILHSHAVNQLFTRDAAGNHPYKPTPEHQHSQSHILLFTGDGITFKYQGQKYPTRRGLLLLISPDEPHMFDPPPDPGELKMLEITFFFSTNGRRSLVPLNVWLSALSGVDFPPLTSPVQLDEIQTCHMIGLHERLMARWEQGGTLMWFGMHAIMLDIFAFLLENVYCSLLLNQRDSPEKIRMIQARDNIDHRYNESLQVKELAGIAHLSNSYFCRQFKKIFGVAPIAYLHGRRIMAAKTLLATTNLPIKKIAEQVGYGNVYSFSKAFKQTSGCAPGKYCNSLQPTKYQQA